LDGINNLLTLFSHENKKFSTKKLRFLTYLPARFAGSAFVAGATPAKEAALARRAGRKIEGF